jgi:hypothetical protein
VLEVAFAAEELDIGAVEEAGADGVVGQAVHVLDQVQADHEAGRQAGPCTATIRMVASVNRDERRRGQPEVGRSPAVG